MGTARLSSRAIIGRFYQTLEAAMDAYVAALAMTIQSDQPSEEYRWLGMSPQLREWIGGRHAKGLRDSGIIIPNKKFEATLDIDVDDLRRDKTGQILVRIDELADRANRFKGKLISDRILEAESAVCYDGQFFFDTDHSEGDSGTQSNDISADISTFPTSVHGSGPTAPSAGEMAYVIAKSIETMLGFKDDQGEPLNEEAMSFLVVVPTSLLSATALALSGKPLENGDTSVVGSLDGMTIRARANPRLTWTDKVATFRTDGRTKPFILQEETPIQVDAVAEGSELEFNEDKHHYGVKWRGNAGFGQWQHGVLATMV
jgi:phage major head subunit gpT-like protein